MRVHQALAAFAFTMAGSLAAPGTLLIDGGGASAPDTLQRLAALIGGDKSVCFITTANPGPSSEGRWLRSFGLLPKAVNVTVENAQSPEMAAELARCNAYYFDGGAPKRLSDAFIRNGRDSLALAALRRRWQEGATVAGGSAGAMIMGPQTLCACALEVSMRVLNGEPAELSPGFGFVSVPIDAHSFVFNHYAREIAVMQKEHWSRFLAIDESAAVEIPGDGSAWRVLGRNRVGLLRTAEKDFDLSLLSNGDAIDPASFEAITQDRKRIELQHGGAGEGLQAGPGALNGMASAIAGGAAEVYMWDAYWSPDKPWRTRLAWAEKTGQFDNPKDKQSPLLVHLSLSIMHTNRADYGSAVQTVFDRHANLDWGVPPIDGVRKDCVHHAATPISAPGVAVATAKDTGDVILINALPADANGKVSSLPGAAWLSGSGACGSVGDPVEERLGQRLAVLTGGDHAKPIGFFCANAACWYSYNAAQRARHLGYTHVRWYRGGLQDWADAGRQIVVADHDSW